ncbi:MAG: HupE/UreJ family protein [Gammaproteobacteria bacterium]|nr:HupE/UreJ family protein [Gammaproteobacteria bacterium]MDD9895379.1 HupE/UreJ family protein [Gammaproteobacteria bacterium]MDD9957604.1 HupE/UreJ family protein [Gammaproteobacteria bacterium]
MKQFDREQHVVLKILATGFLALFAVSAFGHTIEGSDANFVQAIDGPAVAPFMYLGAKHMVTGYDHLLFLVGVIFFLYRPKHVVQYVTLFAIGHSITLLFGVLADLRVNAYIIDAIIGLSIVYKAFENLDGFKRLLGFEPNTKIAVFVFGLFHGLGLATKLQEFTISDNGLVTNIISFNVGVEIGQILALSAVLILLSIWRTNESYLRHAFATNTALMTGGFLLAGYQMSAYLLLPAV